MEKKLVPTIMLTLIVLSTSSFALYATTVTPLAFEWIVDQKGGGNFRSIQEAIDSGRVNPGEILKVWWGSDYIPYAENVNVTIPGLTLKSDMIHNGAANPVIDGGGKGAVFNLTVSNVALFNLRIQNGRFGISLFPLATDSNVTNNFVADNSQYGIYVRSENNTIKGNTLTGNGFGISVGSSGNFLRNNNMTKNTCNFGISNFVRNDVDASNTINAKRVYIWIDEHYREVPPDAGYVAVVASTNITVKNLKLSNNDYGVQFLNTFNSTIENVEVSLNSDGICLNNANNNVIKNINASSNADYGLALEVSDNNLVTGNIMSKNSAGVSLTSSDNNRITSNIISNNFAIGIDLDDSKDNTIIENTIHDNYAGIEDLYSRNGNKFYHNNFKNTPIQVVLLNSYEGWDNDAEGNYWSDYQLKNPGVKDANGDGVWDHYYEINPNNIDRYPLVKPWKSVRVFNVAKTWPKSAFPGYTITVSSDHVIASLNFTRTGPGVYPRLLSLNVTAGSSGFVNITVPRAWLDGPFTLWVNDVQRGFDILIQNASHSILYFTYTVGKHQVKIIGIKSGSVFGDLNGDGKTDIKDLAMIAKMYGEQLPPSNLTPTDITEYDP